MKKQIDSGLRKVLATLVFHLSVILAVLLLMIFHQLAVWVAITVVVMCTIRIVALLSWGAAKNGWGWRV